MPGRGGRRHPEGPRLNVSSKPALRLWQPGPSNTAGRRAGARAASNAGLWKERGARMAHTESILNLITSACYEPMTLCIYKDLSNLLSHDAHTNYAYSMQNMQ